MSDSSGNILSITWWRRLFQKTGQGFGWGCAAVFGLPLVIGFGWSQFAGRGANSGGASPDATLMTVNGDAVPMIDYYQYSQNRQMGAPGDEYAKSVGRILESLIRQTVIVQEAKREGVQASDAEIDKAIQEQKEQMLGKNATDAEFENRIYQAAHLTMADFRDKLAKTMLGSALVDRAKKNTVVTEEEARNQSAEVRLNVVLIPTLPPAGSPGKPDPRAKPDAEAQKYAEALLAEVKSGKAKITDIAKANSADYHNKQGGDTDYMPEYSTNNMPSSLTAMTYGNEFDEAIHKAKKGDYIGVVKSTGFQPGYLFALLADRRNNLPKDFAPQKAVDALKQQRATMAVTKKIEELSKQAKVDFPADRQEQKAYYDYYMASKMSGIGDPFSGQTNPPPAAEIAKAQAQADAEIAALYKKDPANPNAAVIVLESIKKKVNDIKTPATERTALKEQLLPLYQNVIKSSEGPGYEYRFGLADELRDKKQFAEAYKNYHMISRSLDLDTPTDQNTMQEAMQERQRLAMALKTIASPEAPEAAKESETQTVKAQELMGQLAQLRLKAEADRKAQQEAMRKQQEEAKKLKSQKPPTPGAPAPGTTGAVSPAPTLAPGAQQTITLPVPAGSTPAAPPATSSPAAPATTGQPKSTPPAGGSGR